MQTFSIHTLGCKVNQYESEQIATLLRSRGLVPSDSPELADLRIIHTCSVTIQAASKSRQMVRRSTRLKVLQENSVAGEKWGLGSPGSRTVVTGCWATSNKTEAQRLPGVDAVLGNSDDVAGELHRLLDQWKGSTIAPRTHSLPLLGERQTRHQRAFLKIQDGCDAHCTYCIIPQLRPKLWSKPISDTVEEARRLVDAGHVELILTGIFLGAYGHSTALRKRQHSEAKPLADLIESLCTQVPNLRRLRLSSLEPGDLNPELISIMRSHQKVVPHFHLPLQSGSDSILRKMNRQYTRDDFLRMIDEVQTAFDRPAITTDIIAGFPGETDEEFAQTLDVVERAKFIHVHAFSFSPRPGTAAARWKKDFIHGPIVNERINLLVERASIYSYEFRKQFLGQTVELLVEHPDGSTLRHGRCERYFEVHFDDANARAGDAVNVVIDEITPHRTMGQLTA